MRDIITYSPDVTKLLPEVVATLPDYLIKDENDKPVGFAINKTPTIRKGNKTSSIVRCTAAEVKLLRGLKSVEVLADIPAQDGLSQEEHGNKLLAAMTKAGRAKYDSVHDQTPYDVTDDTGKVIATVTPPALIGAFA